MIDLINTFLFLNKDVFVLIHAFRIV